MKKMYPILAFFIGTMVLMSLYSYSNGFGTEKNIGITQAPGDWDVDANGVKETCAYCHTHNEFNPNLEIMVMDPNNHAILGYDPGASYTIRVKINPTSGTPGGYGFQMVGLVDADDSGLLSFNSFSDNVKIKAGILGRNYYEHKNGASTSNEFTFEWTAPANGTGSVTFYSSGVAVNKNGANSGDGAANNTLTLSEGLILTNKEPIYITNIQIKGNPSTHQIRFNVDMKVSVDAKIQLFDMNGRQIITQNKSLFAGTNQLIMSTNKVPNGSYILAVQTNQGKIAKKILVMH